MATAGSSGQKRVAVFGGSFNPPHMGHVYVVAHVLATEPIDEVWMVPTCKHPFGKKLAPYEARYLMCGMVADLFGERARVSDIEARIEGGASWTVDTIARLMAENSQNSFALVIGSDLVGELDRWKEADRLREMVRLIVINRAGAPAEGPGPQIPDVSSSWIRDRLRQGESVRGWVPQEVAEACEREGWFRQ